VSLQLLFMSLPLFLCDTGRSRRRVPFALSLLARLTLSALTGWQLIFYILGALTVFWGGVLYFFLADGPSNARWLNDEDRALAVGRVAANGTGIKSSKFEWHQAKAALLDPKAWLLTIAMVSFPSFLFVPSLPDADPLASLLSVRILCSQRYPYQLLWSYYQGNGILHSQRRSFG